MVICLERGADFHMVQLMPLPLTVSCFSKIQIGFTFLVLADRCMYVCTICLERGADLHMVQLMPLPLTVSCFSKIQIGFTFLVLADGCMYVCINILLAQISTSK